MLDRAVVAARPSRPMNLYHLDPLGVAVEGVERLFRWSDRVGRALAPWALGMPPRDVAAIARDSAIGKRISGLTEWAKVGRAEAIAGRADAARAVIEIAELFHAPMGALEELDDATLREQDDAIDLVLIAANARVQIGRGEPVSLRAIAALAGVLPRRMQAVATAGEIPTIGASKYRRVLGKDAGRWLGERGIPGFQPG